MNEDKFLYDVKQFRLSSSEEVIAEIIEWPDSDQSDIIVRNALSIVRYETEQGEKFYVFKTWIHFADDPSILTVVNPNHIISTTNPHQILLNQYRDSIGDMLLEAEIRNKRIIRREGTRLMEMAEQIASMLSNEDELEKDSDDPTSNIIKFPVH